MLRVLVRHRSLMLIAMAAELFCHVAFVQNCFALTLNAAGHLCHDGVGQETSAMIKFV